MPLSVTTATPHHSSPHFPLLDSRNPDANPLCSSYYAYAPSFMDPLFETVAAATVAAMDRHLGLLPHPVDTLVVETFASNAPPLRPTLPTVTSITPPPTSVLPSAASIAPPPTLILPTVASNAPPHPPIIPSVTSTAPSPAPRGACCPVDLTRALPLSAPTGACAPMGSANVTPPLAVTSSHPLVGPSPRAPLLVGFSSSYRPLVGPTTSALPCVGLDQTIPLVSAVPWPQPQALANVVPATTPTPADDRPLYDDDSSQASSASHFRLPPEPCHQNASRVSHT